MNNTAEDWTATTKLLPPPEIMVETFHSGHIAKMFRKGRLWFLEDGKMYVYYTPDYWRSLPEKSATKS